MTVAERNREFNPLLPLPDSDMELGLSKLRAVIGEQDPHEMVCFIHEGDPCSKARARWHMKQQRFYTPGDVLTRQSALAREFIEAMSERPWTCNVAIVAIFFRPNSQRIDADNLMKLVMDAATQAEVWRDDCQVTTQAAWIELDRQRPRTIIALCPTVSSLNRDPVEVRNCRRCRELFKFDRFKAYHNPKYCSNACAQADSLRETRCARCEKTFKRSIAGQRYCSEACQAADKLVRQAARLQRPWPKCAKCGNRVSRREYIHCSDCAPKGRKRGSKNKQKEDVNAQA